MSVFEYECPCGHVSNVMCKIADRPDQILCHDVDCDHVAKFVLSATKTTFHANDRKAIKREGR